MQDSEAYTASASAYMYIGTYAPALCYATAFFWDNKTEHDRHLGVCKLDRGARLYDPPPPR